MEIKVVGNKIRIDWEVAGTSYVIYRKEEGQTFYELYMETEKTFIEDISVFAGLNYSYKVYNQIGDLVGLFDIKYSIADELFDQLPDIWKYFDTKGRMVVKTTDGSNVVDTLGNIIIVED